MKLTKGAPKMNIYNERIRKTADEKKKPVNIKLPESLHKRLKVQAAFTGETLHNIMVRLLDEAADNF